MTNLFSDGSSSAFAELPVPASYLSWTRGNASLKALAESDPGLYFGGWRAFVKDFEGNDLPSLPIPKVNRTSQDGKHDYVVHATNVLNFLPMKPRTRFELRERTVNEDGREYDKVIACSKIKLPGYVPYRQVFGLVFDLDTNARAPGVVKVFKWSAFISMERAGQAWNKVVVPEGYALIRRYGSIGKEGRPNFEVYGQGHSTPIEAVGIDKPRLIQVTPDMIDLLHAAEAWANCPRWNASGEVQDEPSGKDLFLARCDELGFSNIDIEQVLAENGNNYAKALESLSPESINADFADTDVVPDDMS